MILINKGKKIFLIALIFSLSELCGYPAGWSDDILLTPEDTRSRAAPLDVDVDSNCCVWAVWDSAWIASGTGEILYSKRDSMGGCIIPETDISNNPSYSIGARMAVDASNNIQFIWRDWSPTGDGVWHAKIADDGSVLVPAHLAINGIGSGDMLIPEMVINKYREINIIWDDSPNGYNQMNWSKLDSMGNPIVARLKISPGISSCYWPGIGIDSMANVHLAYRNNDSMGLDRLMYTKIDKDGNFLIPGCVLDTGNGPCIIANPSQTINIIYTRNTSTHTRLKYLKLDQNGNIIVAPKNISNNPSPGPPRVAMDSCHNLHVVWELSDTMKIFYTKLDTMGNNIIPPMEIVYGSAIWPKWPSIAVDRHNRLHMIWQDDRGALRDIYYKRGKNDQGFISTTNEYKEQAMLYCTPNPFNTKLLIRFSTIMNYDNLKITIYNSLGRKVRELFPKKLSSIIAWNGLDDKGNKLPPGVYLIRYLRDKTFVTEKVIKCNN